MSAIERIEIRSPLYRECRTFRLSWELVTTHVKADAFADLRHGFMRDFGREVAGFEWVAERVRVTLKDVETDDEVYTRLAQELLVRLLKAVGQPWLVKPAAITHL